MIKSSPFIFDRLNNIYPYKKFEPGKIYHCQNLKNKFNLTSNNQQLEIDGWVFIIIPLKINKSHTKYEYFSSNIQFNLIVSFLENLLWLHAQHSTTIIVST